MTITRWDAALHDAVAEYMTALRAAFAAATWEVGASRYTAETTVLVIVTAGAATAVTATAVNLAAEGLTAPPAHVRPSHKIARLTTAIAEAAPRPRLTPADGTTARAINGARIDPVRPPCRVTSRRPLRLTFAGKLSRCCLMLRDLSSPPNPNMYSKLALLVAHNSITLPTESTTIFTTDVLKLWSI